MDVLQRLKDIMNEKEISEYKLAKLSKVPQSTINSMFRKYNNPSIYTLESLCNGLGISMSEFFYQENNDTNVIKDSELKTLLQEWEKLNFKQKKALLNLISAFSIHN